MSTSSGIDRRLLTVASVVVLGAIMSILDTTIVNVAIATLARDFHATLSTIQWVSTGYMLALASVIPLTGWAADRFGTKRLWIISVGLFLVGSALSGFAWSAGSLIVFRVLQGLGGGMIMPAGMTVLTRAAGPQRVGRVMSVVGVPMVLGPVLGPILGGLLVDQASWRWIFFVNLPIGAVALPLAWRILERDRPEPSQRLDLRGLLLLSPGLTLLVYGLAETSSAGGLSSSGALAGLLGGATLIVLFVVHALRTPQPLLDLRLFGERAFAAAVGNNFLLIAAMFGSMLLLPLYFQIARGQTALAAGLLLAPQGIGAALTMPIAGRITDRAGPGKVVLTGLTLVALGTLAFTQVTAHTSYVLLAAAMFVTGLGMGATMMPAMSAAYQTLAPEAIARATTTLNITQRVGGSIGTAFLAVVLQGQISARIPLAHGKGLGAVQSVPPALHAHIDSALAASFSHTFWWAFAMAVVAFIPASLLPRRRPEPAPTPTPAAPASPAVGTEVAGELVGRH